MPPRIQRTPHGDVSLTSRWMRDRYYLVASGPETALRWMFPASADFERLSPATVRLAFPPAPSPVTIERELRRICAQWQDAWENKLQDHREGLESVPTPLPAQAKPVLETLGQYLDHRHAERKVEVSQMTSDRDRYKLKLWTDELGRELRLEDLSPTVITSALARIAQRTSPQTANAALALLKTYLTWASNTGLLRDRSHLTVRRHKVIQAARHHRAWWTSDEVRLALEAAAKDSHQPTALLLVALGCYLGLRVEEIIMQRWQDLDLEAVDPKTGERRPVCHVTPHDDWKPKDGEARDIPICEPLLAILRQHRQSSGYLLQAEEHRKGRPRGGGHGLDYRYDPKKVWARIVKQVQARGGKPITMYGMRHSFASNLLIAGVSDVKVSRWLGHADTRMVHRHYGHLLSYDGDINALSDTQQGT
jgi:integrase